MRKFFIILSGIYIAILGIFIISTSTIRGFLHLNEYKEGLPYAIGGIFIFLMLALWLVLTGIGIIRKKNWARYSLFTMSFFAIFIGLICYLVAFIHPVTTSLMFFAIPTVFLIAIPIYFLVFFNRRSIKELFISKEQELKQSPRPFGITLIAILTFIGVIPYFIYVFNPPPGKIPFFGIILLSGVSSRIYYLSMAVISCYIALGLLRLQKGAWITFVVYNIFIILFGLVNIFTISETTWREIMPPMKEGFPSPPLMFYKMIVGMGILISIIFLAYVISKKKLFFKAETTPNVPK